MWRIEGLNPEFALYQVVTALKLKEWAAEDIMVEEM